MKTPISRRFVLGGVVGVLLLSQGGCYLLSPGHAPRELVIWAAPRGVEEQGFKRLCRRFEQENPGIVVSSIGALTPDKLIRAIVAAAPPDLAYLYGPAAVGPMAANGGLLPLDSYFQKSGMRVTDFLPTTIAQGTYQDKLYAMPVTRDSRALYWNRKCFREAGLDPEKPPKTLEEAMEMALRLTKFNPDGSLARVGLYLPEEPPIVFALFGGGVWDERAKRITANRPENIAALKWLVKLSDAQGGYSKISALISGFGNYQSAQNPIATGKIAMKIEGEWAAMHLDKYAPGTDYKLAEAPHPAARPDLKNMAWQDGDVMVIPRGSPNPDLAWKFIQWMQQPRQQEEYALIMNNLPSLVSLRDSPRFAEGPRSRRNLGFVLKHIATNNPNSYFFPALPVTQLYQDTLRTAFDKALYHEKTPEQALAEVQARIERELRTYENL